MEALAILGLVSNIIALIDAAAKAATTCHQIYKHGASIEDLDLMYINDQLEQSYSNLR